MKTLIVENRIFSAAAAALVTIFCGLVLGGVTVYADSYDGQDGDFNDMPYSLPDLNRYPLTYGGDNQSPTFCVNISPRKCNAGPLNRDEAYHQYLTLSNGTINDDNTIGRYPAGEMHFTVYARGQGGAAPTIKPAIHLYLVDRGIGNTRACEGYSLVPTLSTYRTNAFVTYPGRINVDGCNNKQYTVVSQGTDYRWVPVNEPGFEGIYAVSLAIAIADHGDTTKQSSFNLFVDGDGGAKLGYAKTPDDGDDGNNDINDWVNVYPTNIANGHDIYFDFAPPCDNNQGIDFRWDDGNKGQSGIQADSRGSVVIRQYKQDGTYDSSITRSLGRHTENSFILPLNQTQYSSGGKTYSYKYRVIFTDIDGGNGISFRYPFESANFRINCEEGWRLRQAQERNFATVKVELPAQPTEVNGSGDTVVRPKPAGYEPNTDCSATYTAAQTTSRSRCHSWNTYYGGAKTATRNALDTVSIKHYLENYDRNGAPTHGGAAEDDHQTQIQYMYDLVGKSAPNSTGYIDRFNGAKFSAAIAKEDDWLVGGMGDNGTSYSTRRPADPSSNALYDDFLYEPQEGYRYCEQMITEHPRNSGGAAIKKSVCVSLTFGDPVPCEEPWSITSGGELRRDAGGWNIPLGASFTNGAVGQRYGFFAQAHNDGPSGAKSHITVSDIFSAPGWDGSRNFAGNWSELIAEHTVVASDAGRAFPVNFKFDPTYYKNDDTGCGSGGENPTALSLSVPWYYHIKPQTTITGGDAGTVEQGDPIEVTGTLSLPSNDATGLEGDAATDSEEGGRSHTYSKPTTWNIIQFTTSNAATATANVPSNKTGSAGPCADMATFAVPGLAGCSVVASGSDSLEIESIDHDYTANIGVRPVGTIVCHVMAVNNPVDSPNAWSVKPAWRYSAARCLTVVKSPKVQFQNGDISVGRYREVNGRCQQLPKENAIIRATGSSVNNPYGSWIEYGAFATGAITGFGSGAYPQGTTGSNYKKLSFTNTSATPGNFVYASSCLSDPFNINGELNTITETTIRPGDYFSTHTNDKSGYMTTPGNDITIGEPAAEAGSGDSGTSTASPPGKNYIVEQCSAWTNTIPAGWQYTSSAGQANNKSSGCNESGDSFLKLWLGATRNQSEYSQFTFSVPTGSKIKKLEAYRQMQSGRVDYYRGSWATLNNSAGGMIDRCLNYSGGGGWCQNLGDPTAYENGHIAFDLDDSSIAIRADCRVDRDQAAIRYYGGEGADVQCPDEGDTSYALKDIKFTVEDATSPGVTVDNLGLKTTTDTQVISGTQPLSFKGNDTGSGVYGYVLKAYGPTNKTIANASFGSGGTCKQGVVSTPTPCPVEVPKIIDVDTTTLSQYGIYTFTLQVTDQAGNTSSVKSWKAVVDNRKLLGADYNAFKSRNIVVWARLAPGKSCGDTGAGGNVNISTDITYKMDGYAKLSEIPRIMFLADCDIVIDDSVGEVSAWLVAKKSVMTCSRTTAGYFKTPSGGHPNQADCNKQLTVNGAVQANKLLLMRTHGADLSSPDTRSNPAEVFNLRSDQILSTWARGQTSSSLRTIYQTDLPPRY